MDSSQSSSSSSPLFVAANDSGSQCLVTELLNDFNFHSWKIAITFALEAKVKLEIIDGTVSEPPSTHPDYLPWRRANSLVCAWLLNSVSKDLVASLNMFTRASDMWKDIINRYSQGSHARIFQLKRDIHNLNQGSLSVSAYFSKFKALWSEFDGYSPRLACDCLDTCSLIPAFTAYRHRDAAITFLNGLNSSYDSICDQILLLDPLPDMSVIFAKKIQTEKQRFLHSTSTDVAPLINAMVVHPSPASKPSQSRSALVCSHCGKRNHTKDSCYRLIGFPADFKFTKT